MALARLPAQGAGSRRAAEFVARGAQEPVVVGGGGDPGHACLGAAARARRGRDRRHRRAARGAALRPAACAGGLVGGAPAPRGEPDPERARGHPALARADPRPGARDARQHRDRPARRAHQRRAAGAARHRWLGRPAVRPAAGRGAAGGRGLGAVPRRSRAGPGGRPAGRAAAALGGTAGEGRAAAARALRHRRHGQFRPRHARDAEGHPRDRRHA